MQYEVKFVSYDENETPLFHPVLADTSIPIAGVGEQVASGAGGTEYVVKSRHFTYGKDKTVVKLGCSQLGAYSGSGRG